MSNEIPKTTTVTLNPDNFEDPKAFEQSRIDAIATQRSGEDPNFEGVLTEARYAGGSNAYDVAANKYFGTQIEAADAELAGAQEGLPRAIGHAAAEYLVHIDNESGAVTGIHYRTELPEAGRTKRNTYDDTKATRTWVNTPSHHNSKQRH